MRIVHLVQDAGIRPGAEKGAAVHVEAMIGAFRALGATVQSIHAQDARAATAALEEACRQPVDLLYERYSLGAVSGAAIALGRGIPHVLEVNAPLEDEVERWRPEQVAAFDRSAEVEAFGSAALVVCVSEAVAEYARARGAHAQRVLVAPNGVDATLFHPRDDAAELRQELFPDLERPFVLGFHGRLRPWHGFERVVQAAARARPAGVDAAVLCVGSGPFRDQLEGALPPAAWHVEGWCTQERLARLVAAFQVLPLGYGPDDPCYFSPLKLREGMASGVVPIVPDLGELPGAVERGAAGLVYPAGDIERLAAAVEQLAGDPLLHGNLSRRARELGARHSWSAIARDVLARVLPTSAEVGR